MADRVPHPLVLSVAMKLADTSGDDLRNAAKKLLDAVARGKGSKPSDPETLAAATTSDDEFAEQKNAVATAFANQATSPTLSLFAGYLGGPVTHDGDWQLLYLDSRLCDWMLVPDEDIVVAEQLDDDNAPGGTRDVLWIKSTANVITGTGARSNDGRFLVGSLTRAGDYAPATSGGTFSAASGLLCEATTPGCCMYTRTRC